jgi:hypothetical protein
VGGEPADATPASLDLDLFGGGLSGPGGEPCGGVGAAGQPRFEGEAGVGGLSGEPDTQLGRVGIGDGHVGVTALPAGEVAHRRAGTRIRTVDRRQWADS